MNAQIERILKDPVLKHAESLTIGYLAGLRGEDPIEELARPDSSYERGFLLGLRDREAGVKAPKYLGYHATEDLPIRPGQIVTIPKGAMVRCMNGVTKPAGRTYKVRVHHIMNGTNLYIEGSGFREEVRQITTPTVVWPGTGGYWTEVDINDIPEAQ